MKCEERRKKLKAMEYKIILDGKIKVNEQGNVLRLHKGNWEVASIFNTSRNSKYKAFTYMKDGKQKHEYVHRAIAIAFISNPNNYPQINHIDGNSQNNNICNLEWCTASQNVQHAYKTGLINVFINAEPCISCGEPTRAKDKICPACKSVLDLEASKDNTFARRRDEVCSIDLGILTEVQRQYIIKRTNGMSIGGIAKYYEVSRQCVQEAIQRSIEKSVNPNKFKKSDIDRLQQLQRWIIRKRAKVDILKSELVVLTQEIECLEKEIDSNPNFNARYASDKISQFTQVM
jgi:predicted DNA-binding protein YlxM (UPF0122 family)